VAGKCGVTKMYRDLDNLLSIKLHEYGIHTEDSTHRVHVDIVSKKIFIYKTANGVSILPEPISVKKDEDFEAGWYRLVRPRWNNFIPTARGVRVFYAKIEDCVSVDIPENFIEEFMTPEDYTSTTAKGEVATKIVIGMMDKGLVPFAISVQNIDDIKFQIKGVDLQTSNFLIQVKFDYDCFSKGLFLQTHEINPYKQH